jgi:taurine dioxygenase
MRPSFNRLSSVLGAEVLGADLSKPLADEKFNELRQAWLDADGVLIIRGQDLSPDQLIAFCGRFGELVTQFADPDYQLPDHPEIYRVSNKKQGGKPLGRAKVYPFWHSTLSYKRRPAMASFLHAIELPEVAGDTMFANMYAAYDSLSPTMRGMISDLSAVHDVANASHGATVANGADEAVEHPVVQTHPETGRKALYVNFGFTSHLVGLEPSEGTALLGFLNRHSTRPENVYRHRWLVGDLVVWDNRCTLHNTLPDEAGTGARYMHRATALCDA